MGTPFPNGYFQQWSQFGGASGGNWSAAQAVQGSSPYGAGQIAGAGNATLAALYNANARPAEPPENAGLKLGEIIAHRVWMVSEDGHLRSVYMPAIWKPGEPMEGNPNAGDGVHAWKTLSGAIAYAPRLSVIGRVALWGDVIEHENGYRAEFAKVHSLDAILPENERLLTMLRELYGVPA